MNDNFPAHLRNRRFNTVAARANTHIDAVNSFTSALAGTMRQRFGSYAQLPAWSDEWDDVLFYTHIEIQFYRTDLHRRISLVFEGARDE